MKQTWTALLLLVSLGWRAAGAGPADWVNPFIGTARGGNTYPGAVAPWGMVSVSPHNDPQSPSGYVQGKPSLYGFGHVHISGAGCADLGNVLLLPTTGKLIVGAETVKTRYDLESAMPGYYEVHLPSYDVVAAMTATTHAGFSLYTFPEGKGDSNILVDVSHRLANGPPKAGVHYESRVKILSPTEAEGSTQSGGFCGAGNQETVYFVIQLSKPAEMGGTWRGNQVGADMEQSGSAIGAFFRFSTAARESIGVKVGISYVSVENARMNLKAEIPEWDFEAVRRETQKRWNEELSKVKVSGGDDGKKKIFYTALYHSLLNPSVFSDVNGDYQGMANTGVKQAQGYTRYHVYSLWDTYRNVHPLLTLLYPERELDMVRTLVEMEKEGGWLPKWELAGNETGVMVGAPAVPVIADTYLKGLKEFDVEEAYAAMVKCLNPDGNKTYAGLKSLLNYGYIPFDDTGGDWVWGTVSTSLEYSLAYWNLARMAKALGKTADSEKYMHLSSVYSHYYDPTTGFLRPRKKDGSWVTPFNPVTYCCDKDWPGNGGPGYVEGSAWQYTFFAPQDMDGLIRVMGGEKAFVNKLQECFDGGHYDPSNEPDLGWPYLFDYVPQEGWRAQKQARDAMAKAYGTGPDGLPGNDDTGAMSAWYVFSALGFYPVCPGSNSYCVGSPIFREADLHLNKAYYRAGLVVLKCVNNSDRNVYIQSLTVNGVPTKGNFLSHETLTSGKSIVFKMGVEPAGAPAQSDEPR